MLLLVIIFAAKENLGNTMKILHLKYNWPEVHFEI